MTIRLEDDRPIATSVAALRTVARVVLSQGAQRGLLAFGTADDHLHAELAADRASAGAFALYVETALRWRLGLGARFERARIRPLHDQRHAYNTFHYAHRQDSRHALDLADAAAAALALPDLRGRCRDTSRARRAAVHVAGPEARSELLSDYLGIGPRAVQLLRAQRGEALLMRAVEKQAHLRTVTKTPRSL